MHVIEYYAAIKKCEVVLKVQAWKDDHEMFDVWGLWCLLTTVLPSNF